MNAATQFRALVVDDEALVRQATIRSLSRAGFNCEAAGNGQVALEMARQSRYDLVVTDLRMPETNGHQLAVELLTMPSRPAILVLTGVAEPKLSKDLMIRGVDEILFKPFDYDLLATRAKHLVERRAAESHQALSPAPAIANTAIITSESKVTSGAQECTNDANDGAKSHAATCQSESSGETGAKLTAADLARAVELDPSFAAEIARFVSQKVHNTSQLTGIAQQKAPAAQKAASVRAVCTFAAGIVVGWTFSWLGLALFR